MCLLQISMLVSCAIKCDAQIKCRDKDKRRIMYFLSTSHACMYLYVSSQVNNLGKIKSPNRQLDIHAYKANNIIYWTNK